MQYYFEAIHNKDYSVVKTLGSLVLQRGIFFALLSREYRKFPYKSGYGWGKKLADVDWRLCFRAPETINKGFICINKTMICKNKSMICTNHGMKCRFLCGGQE